MAGLYSKTKLNVEMLIFGFLLLYTCMYVILLFVQVFVFDVAHIGIVKKICYSEIVIGRKPLIKLKCYIR